MIDTVTLESDLRQCDHRLKKSPFDPRMYIYRGMIYFKLVRLKESLQDFNKAEELNPQLTPYLWQRGITYYYLQKYAKGARQFELDLSVNSQDVEETLWNYLCISKLENSVSAKDYLLPVKYNLPLFMAQIYGIFAGKLTVESVLQSINNFDIRELFYLYLYIGLYYEAQKDQKNSAFYINKAMEYNINDYMWYLANAHQKLRS